MQERVNPSDTYDEIMQKIYDGEREKDQQDDEELERKQEALFRAEQHEGTPTKPGDEADKEQATVNDLFKGWKEDADGYKRAEKTNQMKDPFLTYGVGLTNYFQLHRNVAWAFFWCSLLALG